MFPGPEKAAIALMYQVCPGATLEILTLTVSPYCEPVATTAPCKFPL